MAFDVSYIRQFLEGIRDERGLYQNTAYRVGTGILMLLDLIAGGDDRYLRRDVEDTAQEQITFLKGIVAQLQSVFANVDFSGILRSLNGSEGSDGTGIVLNAPEGKITTDGLDVRGWMRVAKLIYNMIQIMEQDYTFSGGGDIERVVDNGNGTYTLHIHKEKEGRHTSIGEGDILMGKTDDDAVSGTAYEYYTSWMRVAENGVTLNDGMVPDTVIVELWANNMVPGGLNFPPKSMMTVARRGNVTDEMRQDFWELSTTDRRLTFYWHVDQPILRADNYAMCYGILPTILDDAGVLPPYRDQTKPSIYVDTIFYAHKHQIYYPARVIKEDRGQWTSTPTATYEGEQISDPYHFESYNQPTWLRYRNNASYASMTDEELLQKMRTEWQVELETSRAWHRDVLWECLVEATTQEPEFGCTDWTVISGGRFLLNITATKRVLRMKDFVNGAVGSTLAFRLMFGNEDVTSKIAAAQAVWTRQSPGADSDATLAADDAAWNANHRYGNLTLPLTTNDLPLNWATRREVKFTLYVGTEGEEIEPATLILH